MNSYPVVSDPSKIPDAGAYQRVPPPLPPQGANFMIQDDPCWADVPLLLIKPERLIEFFPVPDQTVAERVNAVSRLIFYLGVSVSILEKKTSAIQIAVLLLGVIYVLWRAQKSAQAQVSHPDTAVESFDVLPETCTDPSPGNPYMNVLPGDPATRGPACTGPGVEQMITNYFEEGLYSDVSENVFLKPGNPRSFTTQPVTTMVNDRDKLADWLYRDSNLGNPDNPRTLPAPYTDERRQRQISPADVSYNENLATTPYEL